MTLNLLTIIYFLKKSNWNYYQNQGEQNFDFNKKILTDSAV